MTKQLRTEKAQAAVLENLVNASSLDELSQLSGVDRRTVYRWLHEDDDFAEKYRLVMDTILEEASDQAILNAGRVLSVLIEAAVDPTHPQYSQIVKEFNRVLEKRTGDTTGELKLELTM